MYHVEKFGHAITDDIFFLYIFSEINKCRYVIAVRKMLTRQGDSGSTKLLTLQLN